MRRIWLAISGLWAGFLGILPHVLHHIGPLAGAAIFAGAGGTLLFGLIGLVAAIPFLIRMYRRHRDWRVPAVALVLMAAAFSLSTLVLGPLISGAGSEQPQPTRTGPARTSPTEPRPEETTPGHEEHH